jgi:hypothetical protein
MVIIAVNVINIFSLKLSSLLIIQEFYELTMIGIRVDVTTKKGCLVTGLLTHASLEKRYAM